MFDYSKYSYDKDHRDSFEAGIKCGGVLYRVASIAHSDKDSILTGKGPLYCRDTGRFHRPQQTTTYCANNVIVCMAEVLFHLYREVLNKIAKRRPTPEIRTTMKMIRNLVIIQTKEIDKLIYIDTKDLAQEFSAKFQGTLLVHPDAIYEPLSEFSDELRAKFYRGIFYPSARHSRDLCIAFFDDETSNIDTYFKPLTLELKLIKENQDLTQEPTRCNPYADKLHPTMGFYKFKDPSHLKKYLDDELINPINLRSHGYIDFVRRNYKSYPLDAVV